MKKLEANKEAEKFEVGDLVQVPMHEFKLFIDKKLFEDPNFFENIDGTNWCCITVHLPSDCGTSIMLGSESADPSEEYIVEKLANQFFMETNNILQIVNANEVFD